MTFVLTLATPHYVVQVSDRRVVRLTSTGDVVWLDDESNKAVFWRGRHCCAYAGLADLGEDGRTDIWLAKFLDEIEGELDGSSDLTVAWDRVADRCTREFDNPRNRRLSADARAHTFVIAGWATLDGGDELHAYILRVTNQLDPTGRWLEIPADEFSVVPIFLEPAQAGLIQAGHQMDEDELTAFIQQVGAIVDAFPGPDAAVTALAEKIREVASREPTVGTGLMVSVMPRASVHANTESILFSPQAGVGIASGRDLESPDALFQKLGAVMNAGAPSFYYWPSSDGAKLFYGPIAVGGGTVIKGLTAGPAGSVFEATEEKNQSSERTPTDDDRRGQDA